MSLAKALDKLVAKLLQAQPPEASAQHLLQDQPQSSDDFFIHDALWGSIRLHPHEIALLDTPLAQRLRRIRQLGSAYHVFPSAAYSRFEHTLGVMHLATEMAEALQRAHPDDINATHIANLRMAALCHDLGHGPFSHSTEPLLAALDDTGKLAADGAGAAEHLSAMIVTSKPMKKLFASLNAQHDCRLDADFIAKAIRGQLPAEQAYLGEIIHGPFDADKLDYLARDGMFTGMPIKLDTGRIFASLDIASQDGGRRRLIGRISAAAALIQLVQHRHHMAMTVYHHKVCRATTAMLYSALCCAVENQTLVDGRPIDSPLDLLRLDDEMLLAPATVAPSRAASILEDLRQRRLFKVAARIDGHHLNADQLAGLTEQAPVLHAELASRANVPIELLAISVFKQPRTAEASGMLIRQGDKLRTLSEVMSLGKDGLPLHRLLERHLVFCPQQYVEQVHKHAPDVLAQALGDAVQHIERG